MVMRTAPQSDHRLPAYQRLRDEFLHNISQREWVPGDAIPTEQELARRTGTSVGTVRKAIEILVADGLLERFQGRGTFVRRPSFDSSPFRFFRFEKGTGERTVPLGRILSRTVKPAEPDIAGILQLRKSAKLICIERLRLFDNDPVLLEQIWLPHDRFKRFLDLEIGQIGNLLYDEYDRHCGVVVASAQETLTIERATASDAKRLSLDVHAPVIAIERVAFNLRGEPIEFRRSRGRADKFRYHIELR